MATAKDLAERYDVNPKIVAKWKKRDFVEDAPMGPKAPRSTVLTPEEEAIAVAFRKHTLRQRKATADDIWRFAQIDRVANVMRPYLDVVCWR